MNRRHIRIALRHLMLLFALAEGTAANALYKYGGEIRYQHQAGYTYTIDVVLFIHTSSVDTTHQVVLDLGDGSTDTVDVADSELLPNDSNCYNWARVTYSTLHSYNGPGSYTLRVEVTNRNEGILNIPNSVNQTFCLRALLVIDPILGPNNSVQFIAPQNDISYSWSTLEHHPLPAEPDGDSLSFDLVPPLGMFCYDIPGYEEPEEVAWSTSTWNAVDASDGTYRWYFPQLFGEYVLAIRAREWRNGTLIGEVTRDMSICYGGLVFVTGLEEPMGYIVFQVYPGAEAGVFRILSTLPMTLHVVDAMGRTVQEQRFAQGEQLLDLRGHAPGTYALVGLGTDGRRSARRVYVP